MSSDIRIKIGKDIEYVTEAELRILQAIVGWATFYPEITQKQRILLDACISNAIKPIK